MNDTLGHTYGDAIIVEAGKRIRREAGENAFVGRIGGDEFVVVLPECCDRRDSAVIADRIIQALCQETEVFGEIFHLSASVGVAIYPEHGTDLESIRTSADAALYAAKGSGRNGYRLAEKRSP